MAKPELAKLTLAKPWDLIVIGGGSAGLTAATMGGRVGARTLLVDKEALGGDCLHHGCVPSKAFIRCGRAAHEVRNAGRFGVAAGDVSLDFAASMDWVRSCIAEIARHDSVEAMAEVGVQVAMGGAELVSATAVRVGGERVETAKHIIICVGSGASAPPIPGLDRVDYLTNETVFNLRERPARLGIIGAGPIGVELGQTFARLGSEVTIFEMDNRPLGQDDEELTGILATELQKELTLSLSTGVTSVAQDGEEVVVQYEREGVSGSYRCDRLLVAVGRRAALPGLGLGVAGVATERGRITTDARLRTSVPNIYAAGDCVGPFQFTHFAEAQARVAARNALFYGWQNFGAPNVPWVTYCSPELAHVGLTEAAARAADDDVVVYRYRYDHLDRAICEGQTAGMAKLVANKRGVILGCSILGYAAGEAIANVVLAMDHGVNVTALGNSIFAYPTMSRVVRRLSDRKFMEAGVNPLVARWFGRYSG